MPSGMTMGWVMRSSKGATELPLREGVLPVFAGSSVVEDADDGRVAAGEDADDAAELAAVATGAA